MSKKVDCLKSDQIIRAWKDPSYRLSLSITERANLPENPAGVIELTSTELAEIKGGVYAQAHFAYHPQLRTDILQCGVASLPLCF